ncbi:MAG: FAD-dependent oxidoreductase, partial [Bacteroidales bacterium]|nr:FAD-dependent oxidoreductase [Bacteroidales bacterium]
PPPPPTYRNVHSGTPVAVVGAGPAGLFAALRLLELGLRPIVLERGRPVRERKRDVAALNRNQPLNPESNYAFGEGGAGTFSDGKLYTRSRKRGDYRKILHVLCAHGASPEILYEAHPHIGTDRLPQIITKIRQTIENHGGMVLFEAKATALCLSNGRAVGVELADGRRIDAAAVVLATGHSARDVYDMLLRHDVELQAKPFAMGVRVEHPQALIDHIQYHGTPRGELLPAAAYSLVEQVDGRGVYSFCMCPGGFVVPASTEASGMVVNGMSPSRRSSPFANSGIVVEVREADTQSFSQRGVLAGLAMQEHLEQLARQHSGAGLVAPAQRLADFVRGTPSDSMPRCSYLPGLTASPLSQWLPRPIGQRLQQGFAAFARKMRGFVTNEAVVLGVESRTSSPVRIPRHPHTLQHIGVAGLFPTGEGAGYAGGIVSSALDGDRCAEAVGLYLGTAHLNESAAVSSTAAPRTR